MSKLAFKIYEPRDIPKAISWAEGLIVKALRAGTVVMELGRPARTLDQNSKLWPMLEDISKQVEWFGQKHTREDWKDIVTASWRKCRMVPNIEGTGIVALGVRTSQLRKHEFSELIEYLYAFGADKNVKWSDEAKETYRKYGPRKQHNEEAA